MCFTMVTSKINILQSTVHRVSKKNCAKWFLSELRQLSTKGPILIIFGRKMAKRIKLCEVHSFSTSPNSRVKYRCSKLLHNVIIISTRLLTFASSVQQMAPRDLLSLCDQYPTLKIADNSTF